MKKDLTWRIILVVIVTAFCLFYLVPTFMWRDIAHWPSSRLNLGLDLKGGMHIVYGVKTEKAIYDEMVRMKRELTDVFKRKGIKLDQARVTDEGELLLTFGDENNTKRGLQWVKEELQSYEIYGVDDTGFNLRMNQDIVKDVEQTALEQAKEKIVRRVDLFGVREPSITTQGTDRIAVKLPDIWDPDKAKKLLGTTAVLHFKIVPDNKHIAKTKEELLARFNNKIPEGYEIHPQKGDDRKTVVAYFMLKKEPETTGKDLIDARPGFDDKNLPCVNFQFNDEGARQFGKITAANMDKPLAIILDGEVMSSPVIRSKITYRGQITGYFTRDEVRNLSIVLRSGSLPVPIEIEEERTVGPLLGKDSIRKGAVSLGVGGVIVVVFMMVYYGLSGLVANTALILNLLFVLGGLTLFDATLTFPGIAGIVLTVGMAVDANVIIFERIREELRVGKTPRAAIDAGYRKATWTILDANITTGAVAIILFQFGTGPIKGFAVTLSIGIIGTLFTGIVVTKVIFDIVTSRRTLKRLSI